MMDMKGYINNLGCVMSRNNSVQSEYSITDASP